MMIPVDLDVPAILEDLRGKGWNARSIEMVCGFSNGYVYWLRKQIQPRMQYQQAARLYNLWFSEQGPMLERPLTEAASTA